MRSIVSFVGKTVHVTLNGQIDNKFIKILSWNGNSNIGNKLSMIDIYVPARVLRFKKRLVILIKIFFYQNGVSYDLMYYYNVDLISTFG